MAKFPEVPTFTRGEPGFATKLNELGDALRAVIAHIETDVSTPATKPVRKATTKAE